MNKFKKKYFLFILFLFILFSSQSYAQLLHLPLNPAIDNSLEKYVCFTKTKNFTDTATFHPAIKPYNYGSVLQAIKTFPESYNFTKCYGKLFNPATCVSPGFTPASDEKIISENSAGFSLNYSYPATNLSNPAASNHSAVNVTYIIGQSTFPDYIQSRIAKTHVIPGQGYAKSVDWGYRYQNLSFYAATNAGKHFIFEGGFGKHFWGDGYRSLFLSDAAYSYPYFKIETTVWKVKYVNMWTNFKDITQGYDNWFKAKNKYGAFHFLSWNATNRLNINLFEAIIWQEKTENYTRGFDVNYLNPIIFYRPVEFSLGSPDNALMGIGAHYKIGKRHFFYGQLMLDDFSIKDVRSEFSHVLHPSDSTITHGSWFNKQGFQLGYKFFDIFWIKNLNFRTEYNCVRPYTYSHRVVAENYAHFNEPLAHPLGANFWESVSFLRYSRNKWFYEIEFMHYVTGLDSNGTHSGQDIFKPTYDTYMPEVNNIVVKQYNNKVAQGIKTTVDFVGLKISYLLYTPMNLRIEAGGIHRMQKSIIENKTTDYFFIGIKSTLDNKYYDI